MNNSSANASFCGPWWQEEMPPLFFKTCQILKADWTQSEPRCGIGKLFCLIEVDAEMITKRHCLA
jgi:hypothetical protein